MSEPSETNGVPSSGSSGSSGSGQPAPAGDAADVNQDEAIMAQEKAIEKEISDSIPLIDMKKPVISLGWFPLCYWRETTQTFHLLWWPDLISGWPTTRSNKASLRFCRANELMSRSTWLLLKSHINNPINRNIQYRTAAERKPRTYLRSNLSQGVFLHNNAFLLLYIGGIKSTDFGSRGIWNNLVDLLVHFCVRSYYCEGSDWIIFLLSVSDETTLLVMDIPLNFE